jgi:hypothetical protein
MAVPEGFKDRGALIAYDYGYDPQGKMYIWDKWTNKMIFYGDPKAGAMEASTLMYDGAKLNFQGDNRPKNSVQQAAPAQAPASNTGGGGGGVVSGGGYAPAPKVLDQAQLDSLDSLLGNIDSTRETNKQKAAVKRDTSKREKEEEKKREQGKYEGKKLTTLQDFAGAKTDTDLNTKNTLENLMSSLSTMGLGGSRALTRQILDEANKSNRKANATQATNNQGLDSAFNEFSSANENDVKKIDDQYGYETAEADRKWGQDRQNTLYKKADVFNAADKTGEREQVMREGNDLNGYISGAAFVNPQYTGASREMAVPDLANYTQDIAKYDTTAIGADAGGMTPVSAGGATAPGNLAMRAIAINDRDLGIKKKTEGSDLVLGV